MSGLGISFVLLLLISWRRVHSVENSDSDRTNNVKWPAHLWLSTNKNESKTSRNIKFETTDEIHFSSQRKVHLEQFQKLLLKLQSYTHENLLNHKSSGFWNSLTHHNNHSGTLPRLVRHTAHILEKHYYGRGDKNGGESVMNFDLAYGNSSSLTIKELKETLRQLRNRERRSFIGKTHDNKKNSTPIPGTRPSKKVVEVDGDIILGGLMMVHERGDTDICGPVMPQGGIQALETMLYTVDYINRNKSILPGIRLGVHILDDCDKDTYGLEQAVEFIKGSISNIDDMELGTKCSVNGSISGFKNKVITGVVGAASSVTSIQVANLLRLFRIPQVSFFSTSPELSNKQRYDYFARTIPSDKNQVQVMFEIIDRFGWKYVSIIYEESNYGIKALEELERLLPKRNICIASKAMLVKDSGVAADQAYDLIVKGLQAAPRAKGVIIFGSDQEVKALMIAVRRRNATGSFTWIGSDGWSSRTLVSDGNEREVEGTLSVQPRAKPVTGFDQYFFKLNVKNNKRNPWFVEFWEHHFKCKYFNSSITPYNQDYKENCTGNEVLGSNNTQFEAQLQFVSDAVMAFAYAIRAMHIDVCGPNYIGLCDKMNPVDGTQLYKYLKNVSFVGLTGDDFHFDSFSDGPARYNIIHFRWVDTFNKYAWVRVGKYNEGNLTLDMSKVRFANGKSVPPASVCSDKCKPGEAKGKVQGSSGTCCWNCIKCIGDQIRHEINESSCFTCGMGTLPNVNHTKCDTIPEEYLKPSSGWAIGAMSLAGAGILITLFVIIVFMLHNDTPVVRASGRELSYVLLIGLLLCYALTFLFVVRPSHLVCGLQQFNTGLIFTSVYAALLTKTNRIARIFQAGKKSARRPSFISPKSQMVIWFMLLSVQIIISGVWMILQPPHALHHYPTREDNLLVCNSYINASYTVAFAYPILLIITCTVYAILTRKIPEAFNESKYIGFTMYTTCIIWLAFVPIYFSTANQVALRTTSMTVAISLSATVMVACLFSPKLYIILLHPERNVRQSMMPNQTKYYSTHNSGNTGACAGHLNSLQSGMQMTTMYQHTNHVTAGLLDTVKPHWPKLTDSSTQSDGIRKRKLYVACGTQTESLNPNLSDSLMSYSSSLNTPNTPVLCDDDFEINGQLSPEEISSPSIQEAQLEEAVKLKNSFRRISAPPTSLFPHGAVFDIKKSSTCHRKSCTGTSAADNLWVNGGIEIGMPLVLNNNKNSITYVKSPNKNDSNSELFV